MPFFKGYLTGLALIVLIGPVFFVLLHSTLEKGKLQGFAVATGIFISDVIIVVLCSVGFAEFFKTRAFQTWSALGGGIILLGFGIFYIFKPGLETDKKYKYSDSIFGFFVKGFLINFVNPFVFLVWIGIIASSSSSYGYNFNLAIFLTGVVLGIYTLDLSKVILAHKIKILFNQNVLRKVFRISGVLLIIFGLRLISTYN
jgi:threonine/homoserine/homoserine lactone efflux protein